MKTVIIACGSGIATSTMISMRIDELLDDHNISHEIIQCSINEIESYEDRGDVIVSSTQLQNEYSIPSVMGIGFISGIGAEEAASKLLEILDK
ncbi:PTS sugar transporter subunit IIB [Dielma fastidiosa]|uniref:PTS sugar transporter subunit IIB n=1 Tax=Dielma fastidiosa TaxID=1034346 RepID=UPI000E52176E|nr:PTS sugar transporter subunit IIB [Dielma fastidiosa]RHN01059.1 PTS galactitol transporter subunit IIB [Dielma fastidiosa]